MLNRKLSEYLFYGSLALITILVLIINLVVMGNINDKISHTNQSNIALATQIEELNEIVQDNKEVQTSHIYNLYTQVPGIYSGTELNYKTVAILEQRGVTEANDIQREVEIIDEIAINADSPLYELSQEYKLVKVVVSFTTNDIELVNNIIDDLYNTTQIFIIENVSYNVPDSDDMLGINISFLAIYRVDEEVVLAE